MTYLSEMWGRGPFQFVRPAALLLAIVGGIGSANAAQPQQPGNRPPARPPVGVREKEDVPATEQPDEAAPTAPAEPATPAPAAEQPAAEQPAEPGPAFPVSQFKVEYEIERPGLPPAEELLDMTVIFGQRADGTLTFPAEGDAAQTNVPIVINQMGDQTRQMDARAISLVREAIVARLRDTGLIAFIVVIDPAYLEVSDDGDTFVDKREAGTTQVRMVIRTAVVTSLRTLAFGERVPSDQRLDNKLHQRIRDNSPIQPAERALDDKGNVVGDPEGRDVLRRRVLDDYIFRLNRHPGRRVDVALAADEAAGGVTLDYLISENKPWTLYAQIANTGTQETEEWRERFGFVHNQLTGRDDILLIDYVTAGFDASHAFNSSYEAPIIGDRLRGRVFGAWNEFTASDVGFSEEKFTGDGWQVGGELIFNVAQWDEAFLDIVGGARFQNVSVDNELTGLAGEDDFFLPYIGLRFTRNTQESNTLAMVNFETNWASVAGTDEENLDALGRLEPDADWTVMQWGVEHSFYIEPMFFRKQWLDTSPSGMPTLAHEFAVSFRGQYAFNDARLVPTAEQTIGGLYTVRGYPESVVAADTVLIGTAEYRFHVPNAFIWRERDDKGRLKDQPGLFGSPFKWLPDAPYGRADWDFIVRGFVDVGRSINNDRQSFERDETLLGAGIGGELVFRRNLSVRVDWGMALEDVINPTTEEAEVTSGSNRFHIVATVLF